MEFDYASAREHLVNMGACDRCIGRQFFRLFEGLDRGEIGAKVRQSETLKEAISKPPGKIILKKDCPLCNGHFLELETMAKKAMEMLRGLDFETFLVGCRVEGQLLGKEEQLWSEIGAANSEPLKKDLVRQIGITIERATGKAVDFQWPDITVLANFVSGKPSLEIHPLFIYGEYKKLARGIPQTKWPCRHCHGKGCKHCNFTGKMYPESVEELIAKPLLDATGASGEKFHGAGREDIDATMLGWRPFVIELQKPLIRHLDWHGQELAIKAHAKGKVEATGLRISSKEEVRMIKAAKYDKSYEAIVECEHEVDPSPLEKSFENIEISQKTPARVMHRRADLLRKRRVYHIEAKKLGPKKFKAVIRAESGTYIKELISGDGGRTKPSFSDSLGPCKCVELNVLEVHSHV